MLTPEQEHDLRYLVADNDTFIAATKRLVFKNTQPCERPSNKAIAKDVARIIKALDSASPFVLDTLYYFDHPVDELRSFLNTFPTPSSLTDRVRIGIEACLVLANHNIPVDASLNGALVTYIEYLFEKVFKYNFEPQNTARDALNWLNSKPLK